MSEYLYERRQFDAWHEYVAQNGRVDFETFMARHVRVNEWIVANMRQSYNAEDFIFLGYEESEDDPSDAYANPNGGI